MRVVGVNTLSLRLTDGSVVVRDFSDFVRRGATCVLRPLRDSKFFAKVRVRGGTLEWPGELDFCPDVIIWTKAPWFKHRKGSSPPKHASMPVN